MNPFYNPCENEILGLFLKHEVRFVVVGGAAVQYHGFERPRDDLDILIAPTPDNVTRFVFALNNCFPLVADIEEQIGRSKSPKRMRIGSPYEIDILTAIQGVGVEDAMIAAVRVYSSAGTVPVLFKGHLIESKRARADEKDLIDLAKL